MPSKIFLIRYVDGFQRGDSRGPSWNASAFVLLHSSHWHWLVLQMRQVFAFVNLIAFGWQSLSNFSIELMLLSAFGGLVLRSCHVLVKKLLEKNSRKCEILFTKQNVKSYFFLSIFFINRIGIESVLARFYLSNVGSFVCLLFNQRSCNAKYLWSIKSKAILNWIITGTIYHSWSRLLFQRQLKINSKLQLHRNLFMET